MNDLDDFDFEVYNTQFENLKQLLSPIRDALIKMGIPDYSQYKGSASYFQRHWAITDPDDLTNPQIDVDLGGNCVAYMLDREIDIVLMIQLSGSVGFVTWLELSLVEIAKNLFATAHVEFENPDQRQMLNLESEQNLDKVIENRVANIIARMVPVLPGLIYQAVNRAIADGIQCYEKFDLEPDLKFHWRNIQLSRREVQTNTDVKNYLEEMDKSVEAERKKSKQFDREAANKLLDFLPRFYKYLCFLYGKAKRDYKKEKARFWKCHRQATIEKWRDEWSKQARNYAELNLRCLIQLSHEEEILPRELVYFHLGFIWDVGPDQMKRIVNKEIMRQRTTRTEPAT